MSTTTTAIKIVIPVHEEEGWTVRSPEGAASVKARLEEIKQSPKSPETLKKIEERAAQLHALHIEATKERAAKENQRAKEVAAARLRMAAATRQNLLAKFEEQAAHRDEKKRAAQELIHERLERHKFSADAVHAARAAAKAEREHRLAVIRNREEKAASKAEKRRLLTVQRNSFHVKQALAKATAIKEREQETLAERQERLNAKMARIEMLAEVKAVGAASSSSSPASPLKEGPKVEAAKVEAAKVALSKQAAKVRLALQEEAKDKAAQADRARATLAAATAKREALLGERVAKQATLAASKESKEAKKDQAEVEASAAKRRQLFAKLNAADARRGLLLLQRVRNSRLASMRASTLVKAKTVIVVDFKSGNEASTAAAPPPPLLSRLVTRSENSAERALLHQARESGAASRRALSLAAIQTKAAARHLLVAAAARKRAARIETGRAVHEAKMGAAVERAQRAAAAQLAMRMARAAARVDAVAAALGAARDQSMVKAARAATRQVVASAVRAVVQMQPAFGGCAARAAAFGARRAQLDLAVSTRGGAELARCVVAAARRQALLSSRQAKAKLMQVKRSVPAKLSLELVVGAEASPMVKVCVGPASADFDALKAALDASASAQADEVLGQVSAPEKDLEAWQLEGWTLIDSPEKEQQASKELEA